MELTKKRAGLALVVLMGLYALRMSFNVGATLRSVDEAHYVVVAARLVGVGGPLYGNAMSFGGPVVPWLAAAVFRLFGLYNMVAFRIAVAAWWAGAALAVYGASRTMLGRAASVAAAGAFLLTATNAGFQNIRPETLAPLPIAAAVALCARGVARREAVSLLLAGAAAGVAFLTKQQTGPLLGAVAALPLIAWWWRRGWGEAVRALVGSALVVAGFAAVAAGVWLLFAARGAGHAFWYCLWSFNWAYLRACTSAGGYLPTAGYLAGRVVRFVVSEPFMPLAIAGVFAGWAWRGGSAHECEGLPWRARVAFLTLLLGVMWLVASPADKPWLHPDAYVSYVAFLFVPMCLLVGVCVEVACRARGGGRLFAATLAGFVLAYVAIPAARTMPPVALRVGWYVQVLGVWRIVACAGVLGVAGWLFGGWRTAWLAPVVWAVVYAATPRTLGWEGSHLAAAIGVVALGVLWQAHERRSLALAALAGLLHVAGFFVDWSPQVGLGVGGAAWLLLQTRLPKAERRVMAGVYLVPLATVGVLMSGLVVGRARSFGSWWPGLPGWWAAVRAWLSDGRVAQTLGVCGVVMLAWSARRQGEGWRQVAGHRLALLVFASAGALVGGCAPNLRSGFLATAGMAAVVGAALAVEMLTRRGGVPMPERASMLLASGCVVAAAGALALGMRAPEVLAPERRLQARLARAIEPASRAYVWGGPFESEVYVRARAVPAAPQLFTWMLEGIGPPPLGTGLQGYPAVATLEDLDRHLSRGLPHFVVIMNDMVIPELASRRSGPAPSPADLPRFGPILRTRYRAIKVLPQGTVYGLAEPDPPRSRPAESGAH